MKNKVYATFDEAVADIPDGSTIMFPGFGPAGIPMNLIAALVRQGAKNLVGVSNGHGRVGDKMDVGKAGRRGSRQEDDLRLYRGSPSISGRPLRKNE